MVGNTFWPGRKDQRTGGRVVLESMEGRYVEEFALVGSSGIGLRGQGP